MQSLLAKQLLRSVTSVGRIRYVSTETFGKSIGVIGIGMVGNAVMKNLIRKGYDVRNVLDRDIGKCNEFKDTCEISTDPKSLVEKNDIIITALPKPGDVKAVFEGDDGILSGMSKDKIWIDHSTSDYEQTLQFAKLVEEAGGHVLEAPITGGMEALKKEQMTVFIAGPKQIFEKCKPMLSSIYQQVLYTGGVGTALIPKVISNNFAAMTCLAAAEALIICKRAGIDLKTTFDLIRGSTGNSFVWETAVPMIMQGTYDPSLSLDLHCKDNQLVMDVARKHNVPVQLMSHVTQLYFTALQQYGEDAPCYMPAKLLEDALGESLQCEEFKDWSYSIENIDGSATIRHQGIAMETTGHPQP